MTPILPNGGRSAACRPSLCLGLALLLAGGVVPASTDQEVPGGLPVGPVLVAPWFQTEVLADDNVFRRSEAQNPLPDVVTTVRAGVTAMIPIRMSNLEIGYEGSTFFYRDSSFEGTESHTGSVVFDLNFSSRNTLRVEEIYTRGVTELQTVDEGGDLLRQGILYQRNQWAVEWRRDVHQRPAWHARLERVDHRYRTDEPLAWLDYEGWAVEYEYVQPIYRRGGLTVRYNARRQDHFESSRTSGLVPPVPDSVPLRREEYDGLEFGYRGMIARNQPLYVSIGYGKFSFRDVQGGDEPSNYRGLVGDFRWRLPLGGVSNMDVALKRRPLSSIFNTYYIINELRVRFDRRFQQVSRYGFSLLASTNSYGDIVSTTATGFATVSCIDIIRHDQRKQVQGFWEWIIQPRVTLRMTATHNRRDSNCDLASYRSNGLGMTFKVGWF